MVIVLLWVLAFDFGRVSFLLWPLPACLQYS